MAFADDLQVSDAFLDEFVRRRPATPGPEQALDESDQRITLGLDLVGLRRLLRGLVGVHAPTLPTARTTVKRLSAILVEWLWDAADLADQG